MAALSPYIAQDPKRIDRTGSDGRAISAGPAGRTDTGVGNFFFPSVNCLTLLDRFLNDALRDGRLGSLVWRMPAKKLYLLGGGKWPTIFFEW